MSTEPTAAHKRAVARACARYGDLAMRDEQAYVDLIADLLNLAVHVGIESDAQALCDRALRHFTAEVVEPDELAAEVPLPPPGRLTGPDGEVLAEDVPAGALVRGPWPGSGG